MFRLKSITLCLIIGLAQSSLAQSNYLIPYRPTWSQDALKAAEQLFGPSVQGHPCLFEINGEYALKIRVTKSGDVTRIEVSPKYFFQEQVPEWKEPDHVVGLANNDYLELLSKVARLKPVGRVISEGKIGAVTNSKLWLLDEYQNAFIQRRLNRTAKDIPNTPDTMHSFSVYYFHGVEGLIEDKQTTDEFGSGYRYKIKIGGCLYLTSKSEFTKAKKGQRALINAAGPLEPAGCSSQ